MASLSIECRARAVICAPGAKDGRETSLRLCEDDGKESVLSVCISTLTRIPWMGIVDVFDTHMTAWNVSPTETEPNDAGSKSWSVYETSRAVIGAFVKISSLPRAYVDLITSQIRGSRYSTQSCLCGVFLLSDGSSATPLSVHVSNMGTTREASDGVAMRMTLTERGGVYGSSGGFMNDQVSKPGLP